ncbi:MAG TPA: ATP-binding protein, partial [Magnetovibrio sp.]
SGPLPKPVSVANSQNINEAFATKNFAISPFKFGVLTGKPILVFSEPLINSRGEVEGTLNNGLSLTWLGAYLATTVKLAEERMVVFDGRGTVLASYPEGLFPIGTSIDGTNLSRLAFAANESVVTGNFIDERGREMLASVAAIPRIPDGAFVAAFAPLDAALGETIRSLYQRLAILGMIVVGSLFVGWLGARVMLLDPVDKLIAVSGRLEDGDYEARSGIAYDGSELGRLGLAYDKMAAALAARTQALARSETNYRELVESEEQLIHRYLPDTTEVFVNEALANFYGGRPADWVGRKWIDYTNDQQRRDLNLLLKSCTPENPSFVYEQMSRNIEGEERWLRWTNRAFFNAEGSLTHFQAVGMDLTERKYAEAALEHAMMDARAANKAKSNFLANMSHELRTPLNSIIGFSEMMTTQVMGKLPPTYSEYAGFISTSGHHLLNIINDLLDLSKIEAGMMTLDETEINLADLVSDVVLMLRELATKNDNEILTHFDNEMSLRLKGDRLRVKQVLVNVMGNALKFTKHGTVTVEARQKDGALVLCVSDTGIGMSEHDISVALSPFGQVDGHHLNKRFEGTGLGLPLAEQLMEMHGGVLEIKSEVAKGTVVTLHFPADRTAALHA